LGDKVAHFGCVKVHELVDSSHGGGSSVGWETILAQIRAAKKGSEESVEMGNQFILIGGLISIGWHILHERSSTSVVEEVDCNAARSSSVGRQKLAVKVWKQVDGGSIVHSWVENASYCDANVWLSIVANQGSIDNQGQKSVLVSTIVGLE